MPALVAERRRARGDRLVLVVAYVLLHYLFVSQTAHLLAVFGVFLDVGVKLGVPAAPRAFLLLFATNFFSGITPQGSSAEPEPLTIEGGEITPTMKVRRKAAAEKHWGVIDAMYADG